MRRRLSAFVGVMCAGLFAFGLLILAAAVFSGGSAGGTLATGRSVVASSDSWRLQSQFSGDTATFDTAGYTIVVAPRQLSVDGNLIAGIDAATKAVTVNVRDGTITFVADGTSVATYPSRPTRR